jgi:nicotinate-nucleotide adenylyltransferase
LGLRTAGIVGGTFDPIHVGHLGLARSAQAALGLDDIIFVPTGNPWHKAGTNITAATHRVAMLKLALTHMKQVSVDTIEVERAEQSGQPSYTVQTLPLLLAKHPEIERWVLILGSDQLQRLNTWYEWQSLLQFCHLAVTTRESISLGNLPAQVNDFVDQNGVQTLPMSAQGKIVFFSMPPVAVSSTAIRLALSKHQPVDGLITPAVAHYIQLHGLYQPNTHRHGNNT